MVVSGVIVSTLLIGAMVTLLVIGVVLTKVDDQREQTRFDS